MQNFAEFDGSALQALSTPLARLRKRERWLRGHR
jgi:hypothetical protein